MWLPDDLMYQAVVEENEVVTCVNNRPDTSSLEAEWTFVCGTPGTPFDSPPLLRLAR